MLLLRKIAIMKVEVHEKRTKFYPASTLHGSTYVLVIVCLFLGCTDVEIFPWQKPTTLTVAKKLLDFFVCKLGYTNFYIR